MRTKITLACTECKQRNYNTTKEKKNHPDRMEIKKYCRFCKGNQIVISFSIRGVARWEILKRKKRKNLPFLRG